MENNKKLKDTFLIFVMLFFILSACSTKRVVPAREMSMPNQQLANGRILFNNYCATCHPSGMAGLGPAIINKPLPKFLMRFQMRHGLGVMPDFDEDVLQDNEVKDIAEYIVYLRKKY